MIACDTSVLISHLLPDVHHQKARQLFESMREPVRISPLNRLELETSIRRMSGSGIIPPDAGETSLELFSRHVASGFLRLVDPGSDRVWERALGLARNHAATLAVRSLDIWHVAHALEMKAHTFWTFDDRQKRLAQAAGLQVNP